ncbi:hypothetical protein G3N96_05935 [Burkholderia sp. Se-20373]|uniref:hypothetical protein n=1 Tax=Burkholderia sp. Se-20373 TaxID=2703898 RepID=UPI001980D3ED|nr:hypothetical protein [Burkholderia sp. Se-20373]MBN3744978.1 hypothetical protein [Burkholderia sp. Se-20373]
MKIDQYYQRLNKKSQTIFTATLERPEVLAKGHSAALDLYRLRSCIDGDEASMLDVVCTQFETSCLTLTYGLYRSAFTSLRLALEFGLSALHFSTNKLAYREWRNGLTEADIKWSTINSEDSGVFSQRFASAFFPALSEHTGDYRRRAAQVYRRLSEYVHGNNATWKATGLALSYNSILHDSFLAHLNEVSEIINFGICCRFLGELPPTQLEEIEPILIPTFAHIEPIRTIFGGPKDSK